MQTVHGKCDRSLHLYRLWIRAVTNRRDLLETQSQYHEVCREAVAHRKVRVAFIPLDRAHSTSKVGGNLLPAVKYPGGWDRRHSWDRRHDRPLTKRDISNSTLFVPRLPSGNPCSHQKRFGCSMRSCPLRLSGIRRSTFSCSPQVTGSNSVSAYRSPPLFFRTRADPPLAPFHLAAPSF